MASIWFMETAIHREVHMIQQSRPLLEWHIQKRIHQISNITIKYETLVKGLLVDAKLNKVCGVKVKYLETNTQEEVHADLVVDASGFGSKSIEWLREYEIEVQEEKVRIDLFYATKMFKLKENEELDCCNMLMSPSFPDNPYGVLIQTIEDNRYFVTFSGYANEKAPQTDDEFYDFAENLSISNVTDFLNKAEGITNIKTYKIPYQVRRRFDLVNNVPEGFLVVGDAQCRFDPFSAKAYQLLLWRLTNCNYFCKIENNLIKHLHNNFIKGSYYNRNPLGYDNNGNITSSATKERINYKTKISAMVYETNISTIRK